MEILLRIAVGFIGILAYALLTARDKNDYDTLNVKMYFHNNKVRWGLALAIISLLAVYLHIVPNGGDLIEGGLGLAVSTELASFGTLGYALCSAARKFP